MSENPAIPEIENVEKNEQTPPHQSWLQRLKNITLEELETRISLLSGLLLKLAGAFMVISALVLLLSELNNEDFVFAPVETPAEFVEDGWNGKALVSEILFNIEQINSQAWIDSSRNQQEVFVSETESPAIDVDVMGLGLPVTEMAHYVKSTLGFDNSRSVTGSLKKKGNILRLQMQLNTFDEDGNRKVHSFVLEEAFDPATVEARYGALEKLLRGAAIKVMEVTDPLRLAFYFRSKEPWRAMAFAEEVMARDNGDKKWALLVTGQAILEMVKEQDARSLYSAADAIEVLQQALEIDADFAPARIALAKGYLLDKNRPNALEDALKAYREALPETEAGKEAFDAEFYKLWGDYLVQQDSVESAISIFNKAFAQEKRQMIRSTGEARENSISRLVEACFNQAEELEQQGRYADAIKLYEQARDKISEHMRTLNIQNSDSGPGWQRVKSKLFLARLGYIYRRLDGGDTAPADSAFEALMATYPGYEAFIRAEWGRAQFKTGALNEAAGNLAEAYKQVETIASRDCKMAILLCYTHALSLIRKDSRRNFDEALGIADRGRSMASRKPLVHEGMMTRAKIYAWNYRNQYRDEIVNDNFKPLLQEGYDLEPHLKEEPFASLLKDRRKFRKAYEEMKSGLEQQNKR